jgi:hypothetical protein
LFNALVFFNGILLCGIILGECGMEDKITIIEGPPPVFESVDDGWALGLTESPTFYHMALTRLRTFNGPALVERCHRMWNQNEPIYLHYRNELGLEEKVPILAARASESQDGQVLFLWIRRDAEDSQNELQDPGN